MGTYVLHEHTFGVKPARSPLSFESDWLKGFTRKVHDRREETRDEPGGEKPVRGDARLDPGRPREGREAS
jgi:hypothetical protein